MSIVLSWSPLVFGVIAVVMLRRTRRPVLAGLGLTVSRWSPLEVLIGLAITAVAIGLTFAAEFALGAIRLGPGSLTWPEFASLVGELAMGAALEELIYRVLLLSGLALVLSPLPGGRWLAVLVSAALFGAAHLGNPGASWIAAVGTGLGGVIYGIAFLGTRSVWLSFGLHVGWNLAQGVLGFAISGHVVPGLMLVVSREDALLLNGGAYGPEAGLPGMLARFVVIILVVVYLRRRWPGGSFRTLTYAPDPQPRRVSVTDSGK